MVEEGEDEVRGVVRVGGGGGGKRGVEVGNF